LARCGIEILREHLERGTARPEVWVRFPRQLGDVIFSLPFFGTLQREWNAAAEALGVKLKWVAVGHAIGAALFSEADPGLIAESLIETGGQGKPDPWMLLRRWRRDRPVAVINLSQSVRLALAARMAGVPIRGGIADNRLNLLYTHPFRYRDLPMHCAQRFAPLLEKLTGTRKLVFTPISPATLGGHAAAGKLRAAGWDGQPYVSMAFGTRGDGKRWFPQEQTWPALARMVQERGLAVVWLGGPDEVPLGAQLAALVPGSFNLAGQTTIPEACALQHGAWGNVCIDTGLAHTGAATGRPTVTLINDSMETLIGPVGPHALSVRGPAVDLFSDQVQGPLPERLSAHRLAPARVWNLLEAMGRECAEPGRP
jgi:ADP-heptose:LPS heptosyltransferase